MKFNTPNNTRLHWNYFLALEKDLEAVSRYIEFSPDNLNTYSIELAHLLLSAASEVDTVAKCICRILYTKAEPANIDHYRHIIKAAEETETYGFCMKGGEFPIVKENDRHRLSDLKVHVPRYSLEFVPWESWANDKNPSWWRSYNKVKHERNRYFCEATLNNALHALAALLTINYAFCRLELTKTRPQERFGCWGKSVTRLLAPDSVFLRFERAFYDDPIAELGGYITGVDQKVEKLSGELSERD